MSSRRIALACVSVVALMIGAAYAAVPLYDLFCRVTGYGGTTGVAAAGADHVIDREVTIRFDANRNPELPWEFRPEQTSITLKVGETGIAFYKAVNLSDEEITGTATYNVTPMKVGSYFIKIDCFCFTEQTLKPGQSVDMPVTFYVDPDIEEEKQLDDVHEITLSYTFFKQEAYAGVDK